MLDSVDLDSPLSRVVPIEDSIIRMPEAAESREGGGEILKPMMNHGLGVGTEPFHSANDRSPNLARQLLQVGIGDYGNRLVGFGTRLSICPLPYALGDTHNFSLGGPD